MSESYCKRITAAASSCRNAVSFLENLQTANCDVNRFFVAFKLPPRTGENTAPQRQPEPAG
jgi:hypothetical protein